MQLIDLKPGVKFSVDVLKQTIPDVEMLLFVAKLYELDAAQVGRFVHAVLGTDLTSALLAEGGVHSSDLQDYLLELGYEDLINLGEIKLDPTVAHGEILPEVWKALEVEIAKSIQDVADKLKEVVGHMPGKQGAMIFQQLMVLNSKRPILGDYRASIYHAPKPENLVVFDVSGSMNEDTVSRVVEDVVALSYMANAHLAIVSHTTTVWGPGEYDVSAVLNAAEYGGTHYETLAPLFQNQKWGVVVTIADYDGSQAAMRAFESCNGSVEQVLDISLVNRPTYLSEVIGSLAKEVRPLLIAEDNYCCMQ